MSNGCDKSILNVLLISASMFFNRKERKGLREARGVFIGYLRLFLFRFLLSLR